MPEHIRKLIELADIFCRDGAPATAAARLRTAAEEMQAIADDREKQLTEWLAVRS